MQLTELITIPTLVAVVYFSPVDLCFWQNWPSLEQSLTQQHACPRAAYSNCHCVIARNLHVPVSDGGDTSARDGLALLVGLPIGREGLVNVMTDTVSHDVMSAHLKKNNNKKTQHLLTIFCVICY